MFLAGKGVGPQEFQMAAGNTTGAIRFGADGKLTVDTPNGPVPFAPPSPQGPAALPASPPPASAHGGYQPNSDSPPPSWLPGAIGQSLQEAQQRNSPNPPQQSAPAPSAPAPSRSSTDVGDVMAQTAAIISAAGIRPGQPSISSFGMPAPVATSQGPAAASAMGTMAAAGAPAAANPVAGMLETLRGVQAPPEPEYQHLSSPPPPQVTPPPAGQLAALIQALFAQKPPPRMGQPTLSQALKV